MGGFNSQKIMKYVRLAALGAPAIIAVLEPGTPVQKAQKALQLYTGVGPTGEFRWDKLVQGWTPYLAAVATTYGIPKLAGMIRGL